jgi:hypothetical protein
VAISVDVGFVVVVVIDPKTDVDDVDRDQH